MDLRRIVSSLTVARKKYVRGYGKPDKETNVFSLSVLSLLMDRDWTNNKKYVEVWLKWIYKKLSQTGVWVSPWPLPDPWWKEGTVTFNDSWSGGGKFILGFPNGKNAAGLSGGIVDFAVTKTVEWENLVPTGLLKRDINEYPDMESLYLDIESNRLKIKEEIRKREVGAAVKGMKSVLSRFRVGEDYDIVFDTDRALVVRAWTYEFTNAFCGPKTHWCISRDETHWNSEVKSRMAVVCLVLDKKTPNLMSVLFRPYFDYDKIAVDGWVWENSPVDDKFLSSFLTSLGVSPKKEEWLKGLSIGVQVSPREESYSRSFWSRLSGEVIGNIDREKVWNKYALPVIVGHSGPFGLSSGVMKADSPFSGGIRWSLVSKPNPRGANAVWEKEGSGRTLTVFSSLFLRDKLTEIKSELKKASSLVESDIRASLV